MRITLTLLVFIFGLAFADKEEDVIFKDAKVKPVVAPAAPAKTGATPEVKKAKATVQVAQDRQDTYGAPAADTYGAPKTPPVDTYGTPAAPVQDSYGPPKAPVYDAPAPAPVQGEVGTQGYYYYYYPVASGSGGSYGSDTKTTYSAPTSSYSSSSGGGLGASTGLLIALVVGVLIIGAIAVAATFANNNNNGRLFGYELDTEELAVKVHQAIELYNTLYDF